MRDQCALACLQSPDPAATAVTWSSQPPALRRRADYTCISWNRGSCLFPGQCSNRHICAISTVGVLSVGVLSDISQSKGLPTSSRLLCLPTASWSSTPAPSRTCANIPPILTRPPLYCCTNNVYLTDCCPLKRLWRNIY